MLGPGFVRAWAKCAEEVLIEYPCTNETEYYDLGKDPYQLDGQAEKPPAKLESQLRALKDCAAAGCRGADGGP